MRNTTANATAVNPNTRRMPALFTLGILLALAAILSLVGGVQFAVPAAVTAQATVDYDTDDDGLIEVSGHAQLAAIEYDLNADGAPIAGAGSTAYNTAFPNRVSTSSGRMGCPSGNCVGYELTADINLTTYTNWNPIGDQTNRYTGRFNGNGFTVSNMTITGAGTRIGLFATISSAARIESVGVIDASVTSTNATGYAGALVGDSAGVIVACWSTGSVTSTNYVGGLVGSSSGSITSSYSHASVTGTAAQAAHVGGLLGESSSSTVRNSYSIGLVSRTGTNVNVGGLIGSGGAHDAPGSYWNTTTSMWSSSAGSMTAVGRTTTQLQSPVGYGASSSDTYYGWNIDLDNADNDNDRATGVDDPWYFGTTSQYPILKYGKNDYDLDNDRLIDISTHAQLNAVRWDVDGDGDPVSGNASDYNTAFPLRVTGAAGRMGCPSAGCNGYELTADIDLDTNGDGSHTSTDTYYNSGAGWTPIGDDGSNRYAATFKGNGYVVDNLFINRTSNNNNLGLFASVHNDGRIESLGVTNASVSTGTAVGNYNGILAGNNYGEIVACYTTGSITSRNFVGGLAGFSNAAANTTATITSSYSTASVTADSASQNVGGLVGRVNQGLGATSTIVNSYSTGAVSSGGGGLVGSNNGGSATASYWDTETSGRSSSALGTGQTTSALQTPTGYSGIYSAWNVNLDGVTGNDNPWDFGTSSQYPALRYGGHALYKQGGGRGDYDADNDGYIDITTLAQFNAIRYDLGGVGTPTAGAGATAYNAAFPGRDPRAASRMGCPSGTCTGYELLASLSFDSDNDNDVDANDHSGAYWDSGAGWTPIGTDSARYTGDFKGNGFTIDRLLINRSGGIGDYQGLFGAISGASRIETLGVTNADVSGRNRVSILVADNQGAVVACYTAGSVSGSAYVGGLVGSLTGSITTSYSLASANGASITGGLVGAKWGNGSITNSYSIGLVRRTGAGAATNIGGLVGESSAGTGAVTASYYDRTTSGCDTGGSNGCTTSAAGTAQTTAELQGPTGYTGIYAAWNINVDGVTGNDDPWDFGTSSQYPVLVLHLTNDYDEDNDGYIDISTLAQLNVIRHDTNGNGAQDSTSATNWEAYAAAFPRLDSTSSGRMGCPSGTCRGYELLASLDFDTNGDGSVTVTGDAYWNSGYGWRPISTYTSNFKGNGHTINNLFISRSADASVGLFGATSGARIETLGVTNANVRGGNDTGILIGNMNGGAVVACYTTGKLQGADQTGGLVGNIRNSASVNTAYSTAYVIGSNYVGGLVGFGFRSSITNSYSTGRVDPANNSGGFLGASGAQNGQTNNYWDTSTSGRSGGIGWVATGGALPGSSAGVNGKTTRELQTVTGYTSGSIYAAWNADLDNADGDSNASTGTDDPWAFGNNMQYPMLDYDGMSLVPQGGQAMGIPDNWNAPVTGERVAVCLTPAEFPNRARVAGQTYYVGWIWEKSTNGDTWEAIPGVGTPPGDPAYESPPTYEYSPTSADVGSYLRAKMTLSDGSVAYTRVLGGRVSATTTATAGAEIDFVTGHAAPQVGTRIVASNPLPGGAVDARVGWQRCPSTTTAPHSDCTAILAIPGHWWTSYTPTAADVGFYLRMYAYYETSDGTWTRRVTPLTDAVVATQ